MKLQLLLVGLLAAGTLSAQTSTPVTPSVKKPALGVYWFQEGFGFTTSTAYARSLPDWLTRFNKSFLETVKNKSLIWNAIGPMDGKAYPGVWRAEITDTPIVSTLPRLIQTQGFPSETAPGFLLGETQDGSFWKRWRATPFFDDAIFDAAEALIQNQHIGEGTSTDLLCLGLSATNATEHAYGNCGPEMQDLIRRLEGVYLKKEIAEPLGDRRKLLTRVVEIIRGMPEIAAVATYEDLAALPDKRFVDPRESDLLYRLKFSAYPGRSGDILFAFNPLVELGGPPKHDPAQHGTPHDYDRRVPIIFWGGPWKAERRQDPASTVDIAPTLAREFGIRPEERLDGIPLQLP